MLPADWVSASGSVLEIRRLGSQALSEKEDAEQKHNAAGRDQQG